MTKKDFINNLHSMLKRGTDVRRCCCPECRKKSRRNPGKCTIKHMIERISCTFGSPTVPHRFYAKNDYASDCAYDGWRVAIFTSNPTINESYLLEIAEFDDAAVACHWCDRLNARMEWRA